MLSITTGIETTYFKQVSGFALTGRALATQLLSLSSTKTLIDSLVSDLGARQPFKAGRPSRIGTLVFRTLDADATAPRPCCNRSA